jgi:hypothetical protein
VVFAPLLGATVRADAQGRPDFTGKWVLVPADSDRGGRGGPVDLGFEFSATQDGKTLTVVITNPPMGELNKHVYQLDGSPTKRPVTEDSDIVRTSTAKWDGQKLVITTTTPRPNMVPVEVTQTWSLSSPNRLVVTRTNNATANAGVPSLGVFQKK